MIAITERPLRMDQVHARFLTMLPRLQRLALQAFRAHGPEARAELVQETIACAYVGFARLVALGQECLAYPTPLARYALRQVRTGRRVGSRMNIRDVLSPANRRVVVERLQPRDQRDERWQETIVEDRRAGPAATAAARLDLAQWLGSLPPRARMVAQTLARGESTQATARQFGVTAARVSQLRRQLRESWQSLQGEPCAV